MVIFWCSEDKLLLEKEELQGTIDQAVNTIHNTLESAHCTVNSTQYYCIESEGIILFIQIFTESAYRPIKSKIL